MKDLVAAHWVAAKLGDLCRFENGDRGKNYPGRKAFIPTGIPFINAGHLTNGSIDWEGMDFIPAEHFHRLGGEKIKHGDILYCLRGSLGKFGVVDRDIEGAIASSLVIVRPGPKIELRFLHYYFQSQISQDMIATFAGGAAQPNLSAKSLKAFEIPLPPIDEQQRIVAVLDQAFAALARARVNAEANLADAASLRVRAAAALLDTFTRNGDTRLLGDVAEFRNGLNFTQHSRGQEVKVAGVGDFQNNFWLPVDDLKSIRINGALSDSDCLQEGDLIAVRSNGNKDLIGRVMLTGALDEPVSFSGFSIRIRLTDRGVLPEYLCHFMKSERAIAYLRAGGGGTNISNLNQGILSSLKLPVPKIADQTEFTEQMKELNRSASDLVERLSGKFADIAKLRQSLLHRGFTGQLT